MAKAKEKCRQPVKNGLCARNRDHSGRCLPASARVKCAVCGRLFWAGVGGASKELDARCYMRRKRGLPDAPIIVDKVLAEDKLSVSLTFNVTPGHMARMKRTLDRSGLLLGAWLRGIIEAELKVDETREAAGL